MTTDESVSRVLELEHRLDAAADERDLETVERLYAPEFTLNSPAGRIQSQETIDLLLTRPTMRQTDVRRTIEAAYASGDVVVIMGYESLVWEGTGTELDGQRSAAVHERVAVRRR